MTQHDNQPTLQSERGPTWVTAVEAVILGVVAGLALNALVSMVVVQGREQAPTAAPAKSECRKQTPRDASTPSRSTAPRTSAVESHRSPVRAS